MVTGLADLIPELSKPERVRYRLHPGHPPVPRPDHRAIDRRRRAADGPLRYRSLGGHRVARRDRARSPSTARGTPTLQRRLVGAAAGLPRRPVPARGCARGGADRDHQRLRHAGEAAPRTSASSAAWTSFRNEDESQYVLVLEDVRASALLLHLTDPQLALTTDGKLRVIRDMLRGLAHAHANRVLHRALSPTTVLVTGTGGGMLTGFDYARPEDPRSPSKSVVDRLAEVLDPAYVAPECQNQPAAMSKASDVYAAGVIAFQVLTGEAAVRHHHRSASARQRPAQPARWRRPGCRSRSSTCCAGCARRGQTPARRRRRPWTRWRRPRMTPPPARPSGSADYRNLPEGYQLTRKYTVQRKIGGGSFGTVYQVYDSLAGADRAVKIVDRDRESLVGRLQQEYQILLRCRRTRTWSGWRAPTTSKARTCPTWSSSTWTARTSATWSRTGRSAPRTPSGSASMPRPAWRSCTSNGVYHCDIKPSNLLWTDQRLQDHRLQRGRACRRPACPGPAAPPGTRRRTSAAPRRPAPAT